MTTSPRRDSPVTALLRQVLMQDMGLVLAVRGYGHVPRGGPGRGERSGTLPPWLLGQLLVSGSEGR